MKTNKETRWSIARKLSILKKFSKPYLEAATKKCSLKLVFLKCCQKKQVFSGTTIFKEHLSLAATLYYLSVLNQNLYCLRILQIIVKILLKNAHSKTFKRHFNTNTLWNLEFAIFDFTRYKTLFHRARFPYSSLNCTKQNQIYLLWFTSITVLCKFYEKPTLRFFFVS